MRRGVLVLFIAFLAGVVALGEGGSPSGSFGVDADFIYDGTTWDYSFGITLSLGFAGTGVRSRTVFSQAGLESERLDFLFTPEDTFRVRNGLTFDPCFSRYELELSGSMFQNGCCPGGFDWGLIFAYGNLAEPCQTPDYTLGFVFETGIRWYLDDCCTYFAIRNYLGFGMGGLYNLVDDDPDTWVYLVPGTSFEEDLLSLSFTGPVFRGETLLFFDTGGFQWVQFRGELTLGGFFLLGGRVWFVSPFTFNQADFILGIQSGGFSARSITTFDPWGFLSEELRLALESGGLKWSVGFYFDAFGTMKVSVGLAVSW